MIRPARFLKENEEKLHELAAYLLEKETITGEEFMEILKKENLETAGADTEEKVEGDHAEFRMTASKKKSDTD